MHIGKRILVKYEGKVREGNVENFSLEDLNIILDTGEKIKRKFWEIGQINENKE